MDYGDQKYKSLQQQILTFHSGIACRAEKALQIDRNSKANLFSSHPPSQVTDTDISIKTLIIKSLLNLSA